MSQSPFKFLDSFTKEDKDIYFGREREAEELYTRIFQSRLLLVYGLSGTGKSSLIQCGLANRLNDSDWLPISVRRAEDMMASLWRGIQKHSLSGEQPLTAPPDSKVVRKALRSLYLDQFKPIYLIFDQFEELFIFGTEEERGQFVNLVADVVASDLQCKFIFVIREEYLASLTAFESDLPELFSNRIRIEKMTRAQAKAVIEGPCQVAGIALEEGFADALLQRISPERNEVELTYLQVYLDKLYRMAAQTGKGGQLHFTLAMLDSAGSITDLLGSFLEEQVAEMPDPSSALTLLKAFVSVRGTKRQNTLEEVRAHAQTLGKDIPAEEVRQMVERFVGLRILRDKDDNGRYELRHDALAAKIYEKVTLVEKELLEVRQFVENAYQTFQKRGIPLSPMDLDYIAPYEDKLFLPKDLDGFVAHCRNDIRSAQRLKRRVNIFSLIGFVLLFAATAYYFYNSSRLSRANELGAIALLSAEVDPTYSFRVAEEAYAIEQTYLTEKALINAYYNGPFVNEIEGLNPIVSPDGKYIATINPSESSDGEFDNQDSTLVVWDLDGNRVATLGGHKGAVLQFGFFETNSNLYTWASDSTLRFWTIKGQLLKTEKLNEFNGGPYMGISTQGDRVLVQSSIYSKNSEITQRFNLFSSGGKLVWSHSYSGKNTSGGINEILVLDQGMLAFMYADRFKLVRMADMVILAEVKMKMAWGAWFVNPSLTSFGVFDLATSQTHVYDLNGKLIRKSVSLGLKEGRASIQEATGRPCYILTHFPKNSELPKTIVLIDTLGNEMTRLSPSPYFPTKDFFSSNDNITQYGNFFNSQYLVLNIGKSSYSYNISKEMLKSSLTLLGLGGVADSSGRLSEPQAVLLDVKSGKAIHIFPGVAKVSANGHYGSVLIDQHTCEIWDIHTKRPLHRYRSPENLHMVHVGDDGTLILRNDRKKIIIGRAGVLEYGKFNDTSEQIETFDLADSTDHLATLLKGGIVKIWDAEGKKISTITTHCDTTAYWVKFSPDAKHVAVLEGSERLGLYRIDGTLITKVNPHVDFRNNKNVASFSPDSRQLAYAAKDSTIRIIDMDGNETEKLTGHHGAVQAVNFSKKEGFLASASADSTMRVWRNKGKGFIQFSSVKRIGQVTSVEFSPNGMHVIAACSDSSWFISNLMGEVSSDTKSWWEGDSHFMGDELLHQSVTSASMSPNGKGIRTVSQQVTWDSLYMESPTGDVKLEVIRRVSLPKTQLTVGDLNYLVTNGDGIESLELNPKKQQYVTSSEKAVKDIVLFDEHSKKVLTLRGRHAQFNNDGKYLLYIDESQQLRRLPIDADEILRLVNKEKTLGTVRQLSEQERYDLDL